MVLIASAISSQRLISTNVYSLGTEFGQSVEQNLRSGYTWGFRDID